MSLSYIDEGKNPLLYTKDCLMQTLKKNEEVKGKIDTFKSFRESLLDEMGKTFPEEFKAYMKVRQGVAETNASSDHMETASAANRNEAFANSAAEKRADNLN